MGAIAPTAPTLTPPLVRIAITLNCLVVSDGSHETVVHLEIGILKSGNTMEKLLEAGDMYSLYCYVLFSWAVIGDISQNTKYCLNMTVK